MSNPKCLSICVSVCLFISVFHFSHSLHLIKSIDFGLVFQVISLVAFYFVAAHRIWLPCFTSKANKSVFMESSIMPFYSYIIYLLWCLDTLFSWLTMSLTLSLPFSCFFHSFFSTFYSLLSLSLALSLILLLFFFFVSSSHFIGRVIIVAVFFYTNRFVFFWSALTLKLIHAFLLFLPSLFCVSLESH